MQLHTVSSVMWRLIVTYVFFSCVVGGQHTNPLEWLLVTLDGPCHPPSPHPAAVQRGLLGLIRPGPRVTSAICTTDGSQLTANVTLTTRDTLQLTHILDRLRAHNATLFIGQLSFGVCCYQRRPYRMRERREAPRPRAPAEMVVYAGVAGTCGFLVVGAALLAAAHVASRPRRGPPPATVHYSEALLRRRLDRQQPDGHDEDEGEDEGEEDVLLDMLSQPPQPHDAEAAVANRDSTDFY